MGECKDNMKPKTSKAMKVLEKIKKFKKQKPIEPEEVAETLVDKVADVYETIEKLIDIKQADLRAEKGQETKNQLAIARLEAMMILVERIIDKAEQYSNDV